MAMSTRSKQRQQEEGGAPVLLGGDCSTPVDELSILASSKIPFKDALAGGRKVQRKIQNE
jgi:hypothetical protein